MPQNMKRSGSTENEATGRAARREAAAMKHLLPLILLAGGAASASAAPPPPAPTTAQAPRSAPSFERPDGKVLHGAQIDALVERLMREGKVPGLALALIEGGRVRYLKTYGTRNAATGAPLEPDTILYGASFTKAVFAYYCMKLVDSGLLDLDRPIAAYLPKPLPAYDQYKDLAGDPRWRKFTPRMLLSHTSGMPNFRWLNADEKLDIKFEPGSRYAYSGEGMNLLQFVLEQGLGIDVGADMHRRVFEPLGMTRTSMTWREDFAGNSASGHDSAGKALGHKARRNVRAAGSMDTTIGDFASFLSAVARGEGLTARSRRELTRRQIRILSARQFPTDDPLTTRDNVGIGLGYGLGWGRFRSPFGPAFFKEGNGDGETNYALCLEREKTCLAALTDSERGNSIFQYLVEGLLGETRAPWKWEGYVPYDREVAAAPPTQP
jgi:CubicO group peptidase (beta-lactamase class C family)